MMDDAELLRRYATERSEEAFTELVRRHLDIVFSAACRQMGGDVHRAQDVAQMVFADLARKASSLAGHAALVGWLYTSTHYAAAKMKRTEMRRIAREQEAHAMEEILGVPEVAADWDRLRPVLDAAMHDLDQRDRAAVLLRFFEKRTFADVGRTLGLGENAARMRVERALGKLGGLLAQRGVTSTAAALALVLTNQAVAAAPGGMVQTVATGALGQAATAAGSAGVIAATVQFMSTTKFMTAVAFAGLLALGGSVFYSARAAQAESASIAANRESDQWSARLREINGRVAALEASRATNAAAPAPSATASVPEESVTDRVMRELLNDPEMIRLRAQTATLHKIRELGSFFETAGLSPAQITQFNVRLQQAMEEAHRVQAMGKLKGNEYILTPEYQEKLDAARVNFERDLQAMFSADVLNRFREADRLSTAEEVAHHVAGKVYFSDTPLAPTQAAALMRIIGANSPEFQRGEDVNRATIKWDQVMTEARAVLGPAQLAALEAVRSRFALELAQSELEDPDPLAKKP